MRWVSILSIIDGRLYSTDRATLLAHDADWEGQNVEHPGHFTYLFRTPRGDHFAVHQTAWRCEQDWVESLSDPEAMRLYLELPVHRVDLEDAFPCRPVQGRSPDVVQSQPTESRARSAFR